MLGKKHGERMDGRKKMYACSKWRTGERFGLYSIDADTSEEFS